MKRNNSFVKIIKSTQVKGMYMDRLNQRSRKNILKKYSNVLDPVRIDFQKKDRKAGVGA
tara:strand:+ start:831 stop:1007 length:177 start_codon:yes stop_codon:yes gene_type:complete